MGGHTFPVTAPMQPTSPPLIIGLGNLFRRDDGAGRIAARKIRANTPHPGRVLEQTGEGAALMDAWKGERSVILIDAVASGAAPGTLHRVDAQKQAVPAEFFHPSTHTFSLAEAVALSRALGQLPAALVVYGIEGKDFSVGQGLSPEVAAAVGRLTEHIQTMHETSLVRDLIRKVELLAAQQNAARVVGMKLRLGALTQMSPGHFREHFEQAARGTLAENARLDLLLGEDPGDPQAQDVVLESLEIDE